MRVLVFGAGALGSLIAARLATSEDVSLVGRPDHVQAICRNGLRISGHTDLLQTALTAVTDLDDLAGQAPEVILVTVKAYATATAMAELRRFHTTSIFVSLQNGLGNEEIMAQDATRVLGAVINQGATFLGPGEVFHAGVGETVFGPFAGTTPEDAHRVAASFATAGLPADVALEIRETIWNKVVLNAAVNPLTALLGLRTGELLRTDSLGEAMLRVVEEAIAIAAACGIVIDRATVLGKIRKVAEATRDNKSSMLQDLECGRTTEIEAINGALIRRAREHGIPCPCNALLADMVRASTALRTLQR